MTQLHMFSVQTVQFQSTPHRPTHTGFSHHQVTVQMPKQFRCLPSKPGCDFVVIISYHTSRAQSKKERKLIVLPFSQPREIRNVFHFLKNTATSSAKSIHVSRHRHFAAELVCVLMLFVSTRLSLRNYSELTTYFCEGLRDVGRRGHVSAQGQRVPDCFDEFICIIHTIMESNESSQCTFRHLLSIRHVTI